MSNSELFSSHVSLLSKNSEWDLVEQGWDSLESQLMGSSLSSLRMTFFRFSVTHCVLFSLGCRILPCESASWYIGPLIKLVASLLSYTFGLWGPNAVPLQSLRHFPDSDFCVHVIGQLALSASQAFTELSSAGDHHHHQSHASPSVCFLLRLDLHRTSIFLYQCETILAISNLSKLDLEKLSIQFSILNSSKL